jgi:hypothetical protein
VHIATQWASLPPLYIKKQAYEEADPRATPQGARPSNIITLWEPNHVGAEERWDLATLH